MKTLTDNQLIYRAYLNSPAWKSKRLEALNHYGCLCMRCGEYGNDVHHKTYDRVGGDELMEDFEVLCRECHETHHRIDKTVRRSPGRRGIARRAIFKSLSRKNKNTLKGRFNIFSDAELFCEITDSDNMVLANEAIKMIGCDFIFLARKPTYISKHHRYGSKRKGRESIRF